MNSPTNRRCALAILPLILLPTPGSANKDARRQASGIYPFLTPAQTPAELEFFVSIDTRVDFDTETDSPEPEDVEVVSTLTRDVTITGGHG